MSESDDELAISLRAEDDLSGVTSEASAAYAAAMASIESTSTAASAAISNVGDTATSSSEKVSAASASMASTWAGVGEAAEKTGERGGSALEKLSEFSHAAHQSMLGLRQGAALATDSAEKLAHSSVNLGSRLLMLAASGNYLSVALLAGTAVWGFFQKKAEDAEKAAEKAAEASLKATEKIAGDGAKLAEQASSEEQKIAEELASAKVYLEDEYLTALENRRNLDLAKSKNVEEQKLKALADRLAKEQAILDQAVAARATAKSPQEVKVADEAAEKARAAMEATKAADAKERELAAYQRERIEADYVKAAEAESLKLREQSVSVLNRLHEARMRDKQTLDEQIQAKVRALALDESLASVAGDLEKIDSLRRQGRDQEAATLETLLALEKARAQIQKDHDVLKARVEQGQKLNEQGALDERRMRAMVGLNEDQKRVLSDVYGAYERISQKIKEGMDFTQASILYDLEKKEILRQYNEGLAKRIAMYNHETRLLAEQRDDLADRKQTQDAIQSAREQGNGSEAMHLSDQLKKRDDVNERFRLFQKYQDEVYAAAAAGDGAKIAALQAQYEIEKQILEVKQQETKEQQVQRELSAAGVSVSDSGLTATHANKGIRDRWQERNRQSRERKLRRQERSHGAAFGAPAADDMGFTLGPDDDFSRVSNRGLKDGDMDIGMDGFGKKKAEFPELNLPGTPKLPSDLGAPKLDQGTGEGPAALMQSMDETLKKFAEEQKALSETMKSLGKTLDPMPGLEKLIADATKGTDDKTKELGKNITDTQKAAADLMKTVTDIASQTGSGLSNISSRLASLQTAFDAFLKGIEDAKKMGS